MQSELPSISDHSIADAELESSRVRDAVAPSHRDLPEPKGTQRRLRIVHMSSEHSANDIRICRKQAATLAAAGNEVTIIAKADHDGVLNGIRVKAVPVASTRLHRMTKTAWRVFRIAWQTPADIYQIHDPELLPWAQVLRLRGKIVIFDMHENVPKAILTKPWVHPALRQGLALAYRGLQRILLKGVPVIFAESSYEAEYPFINQKAVVMNMPLADTLLAASEQRHSVPTVGYFGSVTAQRGSMTTLEALRLLQRDGIPVNWDCIGGMTTEHHRQMTDYIREHGIEGVCLHGHDRGYVPPEEGWRLLAKSHIGLAALHDLPNYRDSYPTKLFEYMALGIPAIVSDFPLYRRIVEEAECGICVCPGDPVDLARAIRWLFTHPEEAERMGKCGRQAARHRYNWKREAAKLIDFYRELADE